MKTILKIFLLLSIFACTRPVFGYDNPIQEYLIKKKADDKLYSVFLPRDKAAQLTKAFAASDEIEFIEPNQDFTISSTPNDPYYGSQWYLKRIKADDAWNLLDSSPDITIAVIDTGIQTEHPDLKSNIWTNRGEIAYNGIDDDHNGFADDINGWDFVNSSPDPSPKFLQGFTEDGVQHGTVIAGIIAGSGNNGSGITGVTWRAKLMPLKVLNDKGEGDTKKVVRAIDYAIANGADIINLSFAGPNYSQALESSLKRAWDVGIITVAAAGNDRETDQGNDLDFTPLYPACNDAFAMNNVVTVAATDAIDQKAKFSSYGSRCVDIMAPGVSIFSTAAYQPNISYSGKSFNKNYDGYWSGTSMAAPQVSAAMALVMQANPSLDKYEVVKILKDSATNIDKLNPAYIGKIGAGRLDVSNAIYLAKYELSRKDSMIYVSTNGGKPFQVKSFDGQGRNVMNFTPYGAKYSGGANMVAGDFDADGLDEIAITQTQPMFSPKIQVFDQKFKLIKEISPDFRFYGYLNLAAGNIDNDKAAELIVAPAANGGPHIKVFSLSGALKAQYLAYDPRFNKGLNLAAGDTDGDGTDELVVSPNTSPEIRIFKKGKIIASFWAFDKKQKMSLNLAVSNLNVGRGQKNEIIAAPKAGFSPFVRVYSDKGKLQQEFLAYSKKFLGGTSISFADIDKDGLDEIIVAPGPTGSPHLRIFEYDNSVSQAYYAYEQTYTGGIKAVGVSSKR